jgi:predicted nucleotidyltransferase
MTGALANVLLEFPERDGYLHNVADRTHTALAHLVPRLRHLYGDRLVDLVLFGSRARGDHADDSDVDVCVVLRAPVDPTLEIARTAEIVASVSLDLDLVISCVFVAESDYATGAGPFLRNVRREGVRWA